MSAEKSTQKKDQKADPKKAPSQEPEAKAPARKKKKSGLGSRISEHFKTVFEVIAAFKTKDRPTKVAVFFFILSVVGLVVTAGLGIKALYKIASDKSLYKKDEHESSQQAENLSKFFKEQQETAFSKESTLELGKFSVEIIPAPGVKVKPGVVNTAVIHITIECETIPTCRYIEKNVDKARDRIFTVFVPIPEREILSPEGKRKIKDDIKSVLNKWLPQGGKVNKIYFTKLVVG